MRSRSFMVSLGMFGALASWSVSALAQRDPFSLNRYEPTPLADDWLRVERPTSVRPWSFSALVTMDYANKPYVFERVDSAGKSTKKDIISSQGFVFPGFAIGMVKGLTFHATLPILFSQGGDGFRVVDATQPAPPSSGLGDLRLGFRYVLTGNRRAPDASGFAAALSLQAWLPTGKRDTWTSDGSARFLPAFIVEGGGSAGYFTAKLGVLTRPTSTTFDAVTGTSLVLDLAGGIKVAEDKLRMGLELSTTTGLQSGTTFDGKSTTADLLASMTFLAGSGIYVSAGGGFGLTGAPGSPGFRGVLRLGYVPDDVPEKDRDGDGIPDLKDACPDEKGPKTSDKETNGCPVKADRDKDGVLDEDDLCPDDPGDKKLEGCPDKDNDGIPDKKDACPDVAGIESTDAKKNGCPGDKDHDGISDDKDACPDDPGPETADPKTTGCPVKTKYAEVKGGKINILEKVLFGTGSDVIQGARSFEVLNSVAEIMVKTPAIKRLRVEGHTDNNGDPGRNKSLSQRRAAAVVKYLVTKGVDPSRLTPEGIGPDKPIADNGTADGRGLNRRVEFHMAD